MIVMTCAPGARWLEGCSLFPKKQALTPEKNLV
jgi:hypothetical protein